MFDVQMLVTIIITAEEHADDLELHDELGEEVRVVVLHVEAGQVDGPVPVGDRHQLDHLQQALSNPSLGGQNKAKGKARGRGPGCPVVGITAA